MSDTLQLLSHYLSILYAPAGPSATPQLQQDAQRHLFQAQQQTDAWQWPSLLLATQEPTLRFFGAHTLALKISRDITSLDHAELDGLKSSLFGWLASSASMAFPHTGLPASAERAVYNKLCVALSSLSLHVQPKGNWDNWLLESTMTLSAAQCTKEAIYELLIIAVEEANRADLVGKQRVSYDGSLSNAGSWIATSLSDTLQPQSGASNRLLESAINCTSKWSTSGNLNSQSMQTLYPFLLHHHTHQPDIAPTVGSCLEEWFLHNSSFFTQTRLRPLLDMYTGQWFASVLQSARQEENVDETALSYIKLFLCIVEYSADDTVRDLTSTTSVALLQNLLAIQSFPGHYPTDETVSSLSMPLWEYLQESLAMEGSINTDKPESKLAHDIFTAVVAAIRQKIEWPSEKELSTWPKDTKDDFQGYRRDAGDALLNSYYVLREDMLRDLCSLAFEQLNAASQGGSSHPLEATLFCLKAIAEGIEDGPFLDQIISTQFLPRLPADVRVHQAVVSMIGEYALWIGNNEPSQLPALQFIMTAVSQPEISQAAASALYKVCDVCRTNLAPIAPDLVGVVNTLQSQPNVLEQEDFFKVVKSVASVLQALPTEQRTPLVLTLCETALGQLEAVATSVGEPDETQNEALLLCMGTLQGCATGLIPPDPVWSTDGSLGEEDIVDTSVKAVQDRFLFLLRKVVFNFGQLNDVALALSDLLKALAKTARSSPLALDPVELFGLTVSALRREEINALWLAAAASFPANISTDNQQSESSERYPGAVSMCIEKVTSSLSTPEALEANPDVTQAFMALMRVIMTYQPYMLAHMIEPLKLLYDFLVRALHLQERVALQRTLALLCSFINESASSLPHAETFKQLVLARGQETMYFLASGIGGHLPRSSLPFLAESMHAFVLKFPEQTRLWLSQMFGQDDFPSAKVDAEAKQRFLTRLMSCRTLRRARECMEEFALKARGLENTAYGLGSSSL